MASFPRNLDTSWHIESLSAGDGVRRHRGRCVNYNNSKKHCIKYNSSCYGSAHCPYYEEEIVVEKKPPDVKTGKSEAESKVEKISDERGKEIYPIGTNVFHEKYGMGVVTEIKDGQISVEFKKCGLKHFGLQACIDNDYLI